MIYPDPHQYFDEICLPVINYSMLLGFFSVKRLISLVLVVSSTVIKEFAPIMSHAIDPKPLAAFFQEVEDLIQVQLIFDPENQAYPIQVAHQDGLSREKAYELLHFVKTQVDLKDNEIAKIHPIPKTHKVLFEITRMAAHNLSEVYALSGFFESNEDE